MRVFDLFKKKDTRSKRAEQNPLDLQIRDIVTYDSVDYIVIGTLEFIDQNRKWQHHHIKSGSQRIWLRLEQNKELIMGIFKKEKYPSKENPTEEMQYNKQNYRLKKNGTARISFAFGEVGALVGNIVKYYDYLDQVGESFIFIEDWGRDLEINYGRPVNPHRLQFFQKNKAED